MVRRHRWIAAIVTFVAIATTPACSTAKPSSPSNPECDPVATTTLDLITQTFVAPVQVVASYQVASTETLGWTFVTVGTDGFPSGVSHKTGEVPAPSYATFEGTLYTVSGQAIRYSPSPFIPNVTETDDAGRAYDPANAAYFQCVKDVL